MFSKGKIQADFGEIEKIFDKLNLLQERNHYPTSDGTQLNKVKNLSYEELWKYCLANKTYNFQLSDSSIVSFYFIDKTSFTFHYIRCPYDIQPYDEFFEERLKSGTNMDLIDSDYQNYVDTQPLIEFPTMLRYEYDEKGYKEYVHPVSHLHIGFNNSTRVGFEKILDPYAFVLLVLRQFYPTSYSILPVEKNLSKRMKTYKSKLNKINAKYIGNEFNIEFALK